LPFDHPKLVVPELLLAVLVFFGVAFVARVVLRMRHLPVCWYCGASKVRRSASQCFMDRLSAALFLRPYRCKGCLVRFYCFRRIIDTGQ
jgi:hypothetical protein